MKVILANSAFQDLKKLEREARERISEKIDFYFSRDNPLVFAEGLRNSRIGNWRFRIGDCRVIFDVDGNKAYILKIGHRKEIYR